MTDIYGHIFGERQMIDVPSAADYLEKRGFLMLPGGEAQALRDSAAPVLRSRCDRAMAAGPLIVQSNLSLENKKAAHMAAFLFSMQWQST